MQYEEKDSSVLHAPGYGSYVGTVEEGTQGYGHYTAIAPAVNATRETPYGAYIDIAELKALSSPATGPLTSAQLKEQSPSAFHALDLSAELQAVSALLREEGRTLEQAMLESQRSFAEASTAEEERAFHVESSSSGSAAAVAAAATGSAAGANANANANANAGVGASHLPAATANHLHFKWLYRFQAAVSIKDDLSRRAAVVNYAHRFQRLATDVATRLATDFLLPDDKKLYRPASIGGIAGGTKYIVDGVLFKFVSDPVLNEHHPSPAGAPAKAKTYLYGGPNTPNLERASKSASNEIKAANEYFRFIYQHHLPILVPMQMLIDVGGHRVVAMPLLPLKQGQLVYGSANGGQSVFNSSKLVDSIMRAAAAALHLAPHPVGTVTLAGPGDVEVHVGGDRLLYLVDLGRIFPPESTEVMAHLPYAASGIFFRLVRPEFLRQLKADKHAPLSSDAFSRWGSNQAAAFNHTATQASLTFVERLVHAAAELDQAVRDDVFPLQAVLDAFLVDTPSLKDFVESERPVYEHEVKAPGFDGASFVFRVRDALYSQWRKAKQGMCPEDVKIDERYKRKFNVFFSSLQLSEWCHSRGIPLRHLGFLRAYVVHPKLREFLLRAMTTRTIKALFRAHLSAAPPAGDHTPNVVTVQTKQFLTKMFSASTCVAFWSAEMPRELMLRFGGLALTEGERASLDLPAMPAPRGALPPRPTPSLAEGGTPEPKLELYGLMRMHLYSQFGDLAARSGVSLPTWKAPELPLALATLAAVPGDFAQSELGQNIDKIKAVLVPRVKKLVFLDLIEAQNLLDLAIAEILTSLAPVAVAARPDVLAVKVPAGVTLSAAPSAPSAAALATVPAGSGASLYSFKLTALAQAPIKKFLGLVQKAETKCEQLMESFPGDQEVAHLLETTRRVKRFVTRPTRKAWVTEEKGLLLLLVEYLGLLSVHGFPSYLSTAPVSASTASGEDGDGAHVHAHCERRRLQLYHIIANYLVQHYIHDWRLVFAAALYTDDTRLCEYLCANDADLERPGSAGCTPLYIAAQAGHLRVAHHLLAKGVRINQPATSGTTALDAAIAFKHSQLQALLTENAAMRGTKPYALRADADFTRELVPAHVNNEGLMASPGTPKAKGPAFDRPSTATTASATATGPSSSSSSSPSATAATAATAATSNAKPSQPQSPQQQPRGSWLSCCCGPPKRVKRDVAMLQSSAGLSMPHVTANSAEAGSSARESVGTLEQKMEKSQNHVSQLEISMASNDLKEESMTEFDREQEDEDDGPDYSRQRSQARRDKPGQAYVLERSMTADSQASTDEQHH